MPKKLGEALIEAGLLTRGQLNLALRLQLIFGGQLGTCLVELGYVAESALAQALSKALEMKCARAEMLGEIPERILSTIPLAEVRKRRLIPFGLKDNALHVAVTNAGDALHLSTITGHKIVPYIAPEIYVLRAMEQYYGIPRRRRYLKVPWASPATRKAAADSAADDGSSIHTAGAESRDTRPRDEPPRLGEHSLRMGRVNNHGELGDVILDFASERMQRCILFHVERELAGVANWRGLDLDRRKVERVTLPVEPGSIFGLGLDDCCYHGELPSDVDRASFYGELGIRAPREVLVLPIYGDTELEVVLYGDGGEDGHIKGPTDTYVALLDEVSLAMRMLSYKLQLCPT